MNNIPLRIRKRIVSLSGRSFSLRATPMMKTDSTLFPTKNSSLAKQDGISPRNVFEKFAFKKNLSTFFCYD